MHVLVVNKTVSLIFVVGHNSCLHLMLMGRAVKYSNKVKNRANTSSSWFKK